MPELPEVEVTRRSIDEPLRGARVLAARLGKPLRWPLGVAPAALAGRVVGAVARRGKYLWLPLAQPDGSAAGGLLLHLGMSGSLALRPADAPPGPHDHFDLLTTRGLLRLTDPRRFGAVVYSPALDAPPARALLASLGHEPFDPALTASVLYAALQRRRAPVKAVLLAGDVVVGAGNIYACEALFRAGIHPRRRADRIGRERTARLLAALRETLARALELGGSTLRDFRDAHGSSGAFQSEALVYGRAGQPCVRCGRALRRIVQAQRSTYYCAACQT
jgi:formamidopyrimidine-DNA glycosylase